MGPSQNTIKNKIETIKKGLNYLSKNGIPFEIKRCQFSIQDGKFSRPGRFKMRSENHTILVKNEGYYIFLVFDGINLFRAEIVKACDIQYQALINWRLILTD